MILAAVVATLGVGALVVLTAFGQRRRMPGLWLPLLAGLFFPIAWTVWYLRDEHPYSTANGAA